MEENSNKDQSAEVLYEVVLMRTAGGHTSRIESWNLADFHNLANIEDDCELAGLIRSAREIRESHESEGRHDQDR